MPEWEETDRKAEGIKPSGSSTGRTFKQDSTLQEAYDKLKSVAAKEKAETETAAELLPLDEGVQDDEFIGIT